MKLKEDFPRGSKPVFPSTPSFEEELTSLLNKHGMEKPSNTPDFMLARYLISCLDNFNKVSVDKSDWSKDFSNTTKQ